MVREPEGPIERLRPLAQAYAAFPRAVFVGIVEQPPSILLTAAMDAGVDAGKLLKPALEASGGRGGGNARSAQGTVKDPAELAALVERVLDAG